MFSIKFSCLLAKCFTDFLPSPITKVPGHIEASLAPGIPGGPSDPGSPFIPGCPGGPGGPGLPGREMILRVPGFPRSPIDINTMRRWFHETTVSLERTILEK